MLFVALAAVVPGAVILQVHAPRGVKVLGGAKAARANSSSSAWQQEQNNPVKQQILALPLKAPPPGLRVWNVGLLGTRME